LKFQLVAVGKLKEAGLRDLCDDYCRRIIRYAPFTEREVKDDAALRKAVPVEGVVVALQVTGKALSSTQFAKQIEKWRDGGTSQLTFVIGGAEGIPRDVDERAGLRLSLSSLTLPHRLARLLLLEQIYRAFSILNNEPYARED
jgi:23S rRNA (pseudouridine1915-N3)-methyltransferase